VSGAGIAREWYSGIDRRRPRRYHSRPRRRVVSPAFVSEKHDWKGTQVKDVILTPEGYEKLKVEIDHLSTDKRREVADRIRVAREFGDISENAEYDDAKNEQAMLEHKIAQLEERLLNARVIHKKDVDLSVVSIGAKVRLKDVDANQTVEYTIVGSAEANPSELKLSNESPVGKAIIGKKKGETVEVSAPRGSLKYKILDIKAA
jgi:transcription elongation factor GreA